MSDIDKNNDTLRSRARSLYMGGSSLATSAIKSLRTSVVGPGLYLYAQVDKKYLGLTDQEAVALNSEIEAEFELWAADKKSASTTGLHDFYELQQLALMSCRLSGDVFVLFEYDPTTWMRPYGLRVRLLEADRITCHYR